MKSILNIGVNDASIKRILDLTDNPRFAYHLQLRFLEMFGTLVCKCSSHKYEAILLEEKNSAGVDNHFELNLASLKRIIEKFKQLAEIPSDPCTQLFMAIKTLFGSWHSIG